MNNKDYDDNYLEEKEFQEELDNLWDEYNPEDIEGDSTEDDNRSWWGDY